MKNLMRVANVQRIDSSEDDSDGGGDEERALRRAMRASREQFASKQARMDETQGGAGSSRAPPDPYQDTTWRGTLIHSYIGPKVKNWHKYAVEIVTDNAANFQAGAKKLREKHRSIIWVPCAAHYIDRILEDIGKLDGVRDTIDEGKMVTTLIYNHQFMTDLLREMNDGREILRPGITHFDTQFVAIESLCRAKANIMQMWTSRAYVNSDFSRQPLASRVQQIVLEEDFWNRVERIADLLQPRLGLETSRW
ncbi:hypothetical protein CKAN_01284500 [Cinnamomum micranthum f. kanehirae]|uniref:DUF659 domain-containing protein n=1 Tax=Cinnamomum micranthum f. kanehirae TaxID=337451 RepID=A0A3S3NPP3_9MAGN|nr:hypothetical protein CKAN_01284500 [Cinnamomum micranthum f. kanehirae]